MNTVSQQNTIKSFINQEKSKKSRCLHNMTPLNMAFQTVKKTNDQKKLLFSFALETKQNTPFCFNLTLWSVLNWFYFISLHLCKETSNPVVFPSPQTYVHLLSVSASLFAIEKQHD